MLILTRRIGEEIIIADNIKVITLGIRGNQVKIGIEAPNEVIILRKEVLDRILNQKQLEQLEQAEKK